jgi:V/A-type H+-transporting ATPase subunit K
MAVLQVPSMMKARTLPIIFLVVFLVATMVAYAQEGPTTGAGLQGLGSGLAVGLAGLGAGIAVGRIGAAAMSVIAEKPELFGRGLVYVALGEGIAIYGLLIAILLVPG